MTASFAPPCRGPLSEAIAAVVKPDELSAEYVIPSVFNREVAPLVAAAVAAAAESSGVARRRRAAHVRGGLEEMLSEVISETRGATGLYTTHK